MRGSGKILVCAVLDREDRLFRRREAVMEWVVKLETRNGWGEVETIEVGKLERRVVGLTAESDHSASQDRPPRRISSRQPATAV
jgi:hypothetical protein